MTERSHPCVDWDEDLSALIDGELEATRRVDVEAHVASCVRCNAQLDALRAVDQRLAEIPLPEIGGRVSAARMADAVRTSEASRSPSPRVQRPPADSPSRSRTSPPRRERRRESWKTSAWMRVVTAAGIVVALLWLLERGRDSIPSPSEEPPIARVPSEPTRAKPQIAPSLDPAPATPDAATLAGSDPLPTPGVGDVPASLEAASDEELALALELETAEDFEVIANLELLERLVALEEGRG
jgi:anti-sigma factor RsiW